MEELQEFERRITQALDRIGAGIEALDALQIRHPQTEGEPAAPADDPEKARLAEALAAERDTNAQLTERIKALHERQLATMAPLEARVAELTRQVDEQALELQKAKAATIQLRETLRAGAAPESAVASELASLKAARVVELAELDDILRELKPLIGEMTDA